MLYSDLLESVKNISLLKCSLDFKQTLINICQTDSEKVFFEFYLKNYVLRHKNIPILIPQVWIQWHSKTKNELRFDQSSYTDDLYRVDFVAFWNNKRYAILIDDINHYAQKNYEYWNADESKYSKRLREDRKLRKERWEVFRISNWEIRQEKLMFEIVNDLFDYLEININFNLD